LVSFTARRRPTTSVGEIAPDLRLTCKLGERRTSAKFQRTRKSTMRVNVLSSAPEAALSSLAESHWSSESADHTTSRNTLFTASIHNHASSSRQPKRDVTGLGNQRSHRRLLRKLLESLSALNGALGLDKLNTWCRKNSES
jgi:hypothetical protein